MPVRKSFLKVAAKSEPRRKWPLYRRQKGFTLMEILASFLIISLGAMGLASMQILSLKNANNSRERAVAFLYMQNVAELMRANQAQISQYVVSDVTAFDCSEPSQQFEHDLCLWQTWLKDFNQGKGRVNEEDGVYTLSTTIQELTKYSDAVNFNLQIKLEL